MSMSAVKSSLPAPSDSSEPHRQIRVPALALLGLEHGGERRHADLELLGPGLAGREEPLDLVAGAVDRPPDGESGCPLGVDEDLD